MPLLKTFRENVTRRITEAGLSNTAVARVAGIHRVTLQKILSDDSEYEPSFAMCEKLAAALGFSDPEDAFQKTFRRRKKTA